MALRARMLLAVILPVATAGAAAAARTPSPSARLAHAGCTAEATEAVVRAFVRSYEAGRVRLIDGMWAPAPRFQWFSTTAPGKRLGEQARDRATLAAYFRSRVHAGERLRITELRVGYDPARNLVDFGGKILRSARGRPAARLRDFKGAADCVSGTPRLIVWSMEAGVPCTCRRR